MFADLNLTKKGMILVLVPVLFELIFVSVVSSMLWSAARDLDALDHSENAFFIWNQAALDWIQTFLILYDRNEKNPMKKVTQLDKTIAFAKNGYGPVAPVELQEVKEEMEGIRADLHSVAPILEGLRAGFIRTHSAEIGQENQALMASLVAVSMDCLSSSRKVGELETRLRQRQPIELQHIATSAGILLIGGLFASCLLSLTLARLFSSDIIGRLQDISNKAQALSLGKEFPPPDKGSDEIAVLERVLHETSIFMSEARRKEMAILDNAADVICSLNADLHFSGIAGGVEKEWCYAGEELIGQPVDTILKEETWPATKQAFARISQGSGETEIESVVRTKDGIARDSVWTVSWSADEQTFYCVVHDFTQMRAAQKLKRSVFAMVSHDLRSPLMSTNISFALLLEGRCGPLAAAVKNKLVDAHTRMETLLQLINALLDLEKMEAKNRTPHDDRPGQAKEGSE